MLSPDEKIIITGAAGLVGQNLILMLRERGGMNLVALDKKSENLAILNQLNPGLLTVETDLAVPGAWMDIFDGAKAVVQLHAQIGGEVYAEFEANNITATRNVLDACRKYGVPQLIHTSSSVVNSAARDYYTETKKAQEKLVYDAHIPFTILCPTLMFGWFDRKHLGWLSRFMQKIPVFPIPGSGKYMRQPLYVRDFCAIIMACLDRGPDNRTYNITGAEEIDYIDIVRAIKKATKSSTFIMHIPYRLFWLMLKFYGFVSRDPPFTTRQLEALVTPDKFEVIPWWDVFGLHKTLFRDAIAETFADSRYAHVILKF